MPIDIREDSLKQGVLGLVLALLEVIKDTLKIEALKRMESGVLSREECERLGIALMDLELALEQIKEEQGISESVRAVRDNLDEIVNRTLGSIVSSERWGEAG